MSKARTKVVPAERVVMGGVERLGLRFSAMINHPIAQVQRWVTIHRLDTDGDREWEEVMGVLAETDDLGITFNDDDTITLRWERRDDDDMSAEVMDGEAIVEPTPF
ncbi:DUF1654 domain-containing protein [Pseudomonas sp. CCI2.4]|uniref:DUF1654 domain-containing protein n=1 Tax=Pseudomonas sp. CCI2.4 TaxID=3048617 RepID=UPI002B22F156|nr:DUF1654 domain-containing protein [Pseudomonas sp. CCI2.4]MEB0133448.1 DUF1654 domain-containing protein [Pseudomonas sp. CCI2.4]